MSNPRNHQTTDQSFGRRMYTVTETAVILGIGRSTAYELILQGELAATRIGRRWLISPAVLQSILGEKPPLPFATSASLKETTPTNEAIEPSEGHGHYSSRP